MTIKTIEKAYERINVTLPSYTLRIIDRIAKKGDRSRLIDIAVRRYAEDMSKAQIKQLMKERALGRADFDLRLAEEWFGLEEEVGRKIKR